MEPVETVYVDSEVVDCDGGNPALGHPVVWLNMEGRGRIDCPYCGRRFILSDHQKDAAAEGGR